MRLFEVFFVYLILIPSVFAACKSTKNISEFREDSQIRIRDSSAFQLSRLEQVNEITNSDFLIEDNYEIDFTVFLPPDSAGVQHPQVVGKIRKISQSSRKETRLHNKNETSTAVNKHQRDKEDITITEESNEDFKSADTLQWVKWLYYSLLLLLAFTTIYIFRKWLH